MIHSGVQGGNLVPTCLIFQLNAARLSLLRSPPPRHFIAPPQHMWSQLWKWTGCLSTILYWFQNVQTNLYNICCRIHRVPTLLWLFSPPSPPPPPCKPIINKEPHFGYLSTATHTSYIVGMRRAPGFIGRWPRRWQRHTEWQIQRQRRGQIFQ